MTDRLAGKVALITGTGAGIGRGCALVFAQQGAKVFGCDIDADRARATVAAAGAAGFEMDSAHPIDLTKAADVQRCVDQVMQRHGRIDVLVNAAAINPQFAPVAQMSYEQIWVPTMVGEADIVFLMCKAAWPHLIASAAARLSTLPRWPPCAAPKWLACWLIAREKCRARDDRQLAVEGGPTRFASTPSPQDWSQLWQPPPRG